jgi:[acyl-carrier-protein] S-malonyltransferase
MTVALLFPGQGSQRVGMGADLDVHSPAARDVFELAERVTDLPLRRLCFEGPDDALRSTDVAQPALVATALATLAALAERLGLRPDDRRGVAERLDVGYAAGHSLGQYAAAAAVGAFTTEEALRLARARGLLMAAAPAGAMAAVLGLDGARIDAICADVAGIVVVANDNAPGQVVISGDREAVAAASELLRAAGAARVLPLNVGGAFHSPLMAEPAARFAATLDSAAIADPVRPVVGNVAARPLCTATALRDDLRKQIPSPVRWRETMLALADLGVTAAYEIGPGSVLAGLAKRTTPTITVRPLGTWAEVVAATAALAPPNG